MVLHHHAAFYDQGFDATGCAEEEGGNRVPGSAVADVPQVEQRDVSALANFEAANIAAPQTTGTFRRGHAQGVSNIERRGTVGQPIQQQSLACLSEHVGTVVGSAAVDAKP